MSIDKSPAIRAKELKEIGEEFFVTLVLSESGDVLIYEDEVEGTQSYLGWISEGRNVRQQLFVFMRAYRDGLKRGKVEGTETLRKGLAALLNVPLLPPSK